jgi:hypothetical protein
MLRDFLLLRSARDLCSQAEVPQADSTTVSPELETETTDSKVSLEKTIEVALPRKAAVLITPPFCPATKV